MTKSWMKNYLKTLVSFDMIEEAREDFIQAYGSDEGFEEAFNSHVESHANDELVS